MQLESLAAWLVALLLAARWLTQLWLERMNAAHVRAQAGSVPEAYREFIDPSTYARSVEYTLAKGRLSQVEDTWGFGVLIAVLFSGVLPWSFRVVTSSLGTSTWVLTAFVLVALFAMTLLSWPLDWYAQFHLEERFGFNTTTPRTWWLDRLKGVALAVLLGYPLLWLVLKLVEWTGGGWWLWAWAAVLVFQLVVGVLAPIFILPLFNKLTPLPEGSLRDRLLALAARTRFATRSIQVMDGSRRSRHSNAFFTGLGRFRKIVLFDTLLQQTGEEELESVLAHEIGHYKKGHLPRMLLWSALGSLAAFAVVGWLAEQPWFYGAFGFPPDEIALALLLFALLSGAVTFWFAPLMNWWLRRYEYQADRFAAEAVGTPRFLIAALRRLCEQNLSNLTPHPLYSRFYYSHPTLLEREQALRPTLSAS